jgi:hypothetical protein
MAKRLLVFAIIAVQVALSLPAQAQAIAPSTAPKAAAPSSGIPAMTPVFRPRGKSGATIGQTSHPGFSALTADECRKLGGKTEIDDGGSCKLRMRCTIIHANGDVYSSCIDEVK